METNKRNAKKHKRGAKDVDEGILVTTDTQQESEKLSESIDCYDLVVEGNDCNAKMLSYEISENKETSQEKAEKKMEEDSIEIPVKDKGLCVF